MACLIPSEPTPRTAARVWRAYLSVRIVYQYIRWPRGKVPFISFEFFSAAGDDVRLRFSHLADGLLVEELHHFHQLRSRGWLGRGLTWAEKQLLEAEVTQRMRRSGFREFDPRRR